MLIQRITDSTPTTIADAIRTALETSRFTAQVEVRGPSYKPEIKLSKVRLRARKHFCGNHPNACVGVGERHHRATFLEGADWVEFNDMLNDVLDSIGASANVFSRPLELKGKLWVRKGGERRTEYNSEAITDLGEIRGYVWLGDEDGVWEDHRNRTGAPRAEFPFGTPGIHTGTGYACVGHEDHQH